MRPQRLLHFSTYLILLTCLCVIHTAHAQVVLDRQAAVTALLDPGSGVAIDLAQATVWSPFVDFGFGATFEGCLPTGSEANPHRVGLQPFPGPGVMVDSPSYFFWIDDLPPANFVHPTRFVLVDATMLAPTVANGGITLSAQGWWPVIKTPTTSATPYFENISTSAFPPGFDNPDGLIAGLAFSPAIAPKVITLAPSSAKQAATDCGLLLRGHTDSHFEGDLNTRESDLVNNRGVPANRIIKANNGMAADRDDLSDAIEAVCNLMPPCTKIYVTMVSHGTLNNFELTDGNINEDDFCDTMGILGDKNVPICMTIDACYSGSLIDQDWGFPEGSSIITAADSTHPSWGGRGTGFKDESGDTATEGLLGRSMSACINDNRADADRDGGVDDCEALEWVMQQRPCYVWCGNNRSYYPASSGPGAANPNPQKKVVGTLPKSINWNVRNSTPSNKTDFHIVFDGDVTGGIIRAWRSDANDNVDFANPWADGPGERTATYDAATNTTTVSWVDKGDPVMNGQWIHFGYSGSKGLKIVRTFWTTNTPATTTGAPSTTGNTHVTLRDQSIQVSISNPAVSLGGYGISVDFTLTVRASNDSIPLNNLNLSDPMVSGLTPIILGTHSLNPGESMTFDLNIPIDVQEGQYVILQVDDDWDFNPNKTMQLMQFSPVDSIPCPTPDPVSIPNVTGNEARIEWAASAGASDFTVFLTEFNQPTMAINAGYSAVLQASGLNSNTCYLVQVEANCGFKTSGLSQTQTFCTPAVCEPPDALFTSISGSNVILGWTPAPNATGYVINGGPASNPTAVTLQTGNQNTFPVNNLAAGDYFWRVKTVCGTDESAFSPFDVFTISPPFCPQPLPIFSQVFGNNVNLLWNPVPDALGYRINGGPASSPTAVVIDVPGGATSSFTVNNLAPNTYAWRIFTYCSLNPFIVSPYTGFDQFTIVGPPAKQLEAGIEAGTTPLTVEIHPNPVSDLLHVTIQNAAGNRVTVEVFDAYGKRAFIQQSHPAMGTIQISTSELATGVYQVIVSDGKSIALRKMVVQR